MIYIWSLNRCFFLILSGLLSWTVGTFWLTHFSNLDSQLDSKCSNPNVTIAPNQSTMIQQIFDRTPAGSIVMMLPGYYKANISIKKTITVCGAGADSTVLEGAKENIPVIQVVRSTQSPLTVYIERISLINARGSQEAAGLHAKASETFANASNIHLKNVKITKNGGFGLVTVNFNVTAEDIEISNNQFTGVLLRGKEYTALLQNVLIRENGHGGSLCDGLAGAAEKKAKFEFAFVKSFSNKCNGFAIGGVNHLRMNNIESSGNGLGLRLEGATEASIKNLLIKDSSSWGIYLGIGYGGLDSEGRPTDSFPKMLLENSTIENNRLSGLTARNGLEEAKLSNVIIRGNGTNPNCRKADTSVSDSMCNGIDIGREAQISVSNSVVKDNTDWGIAALLKKCGYNKDEFTGKAILEGNNVIEGNNTAGNQNGEICLP